MAHFNDVWLPEGIETGAVYGPSFVTEIATQQNGREFRNATVTESMRVGELSFAPRLEEDYAELLNTFLIANGRANSFRFTDITDYTCALVEGVVRGLGAGMGQLQKKYTLGSRTHLRDIQQPNVDGFELYDGVTLLVVDVDYTMDDYGVLTSLAEVPPLATALTWKGTFDNAIRFDTDRMAASFAAADVWTWGGIPIKEVLL